MQKKVPTIFITGGAGYIGSHVAKFFLQQGAKVVVFDNFSTGFRQPLDILKRKFRKLTVVKGDLLSSRHILAALEKHKPEAVFHLAASCSVDESTKKPELYFHNNVLGTANLLYAMERAKVRNLIFSSTCAVYGEVTKLPVTEATAAKPVNFYGKSKLLAEQLVQYYSDAGFINSIIFRFFNVCGADSQGLLGDGKKPSLLLVQNAVRGALGIQAFQLTCPVVNTPDGTPIRDYIDVEDLARAHNLGYKYLQKGGKSGIFNLGNGKGFSVRQIIYEVEKILQAKIGVKKARARAGEYAKIFAHTGKAKRVLKFKTQKSLKDSILSLSLWYKGHPHGYKF